MATVVCLAGCAGEEGSRPDAPAASPSSSTSGTPAEPSSSPPPRNTKFFSAVEENPRAFLRRWDEAGDTMQTTGDTAEFSSMSPECEPCQKFVQAVEEVYDGGGDVEFAGSDVVSITKARGSASVYLLTKDVPPTIARSGDGSVERYRSGRTTLRIVLEPEGRSWVVSHYWIEPTSS